MATLPGFLGDVRKGDRIQFAIENLDGSWDAAVFDVFDNDTRLPILEDVPTKAWGDTDGPAWQRWVDFEVKDDFDTDGGPIQFFNEGRMFSIRVKSAAGGPPTDADAFVVNFRVEPEDRRAFLGTVEKGKTLQFLHREDDRDEMFFDVFDAFDDSLVLSNVPMTQTDQMGRNIFKGEIDSEGTDDLAIGRTYWVRVKDVAADDPNLVALYSFSVLPRLEYDLTRLLGYAGENMVLDNFSYDQAGNITGTRVRVFSNAADAENANAGVTDPEPGEIASLVVEQQHNVPRNVRTFHRSVLEFLAGNFPVEK